MKGRGRVTALTVNIYGGAFMAKYIFPAIFTWSDEDKTYYVTFPDLESCYTDGDTIEEAMENAYDVLNLMLYDMKEEDIPTAINIADVAIPDKGFVNYVMADTVAYQEVINRENNPIKYAMKKAGLNIKKLSDLLEAPYRTVQDWVSGKKKPPKWCQKLIIEKIEASI